MKIIQEISRIEIVRRFSNYRDAKYFINHDFKHCYLIALTKDEYERLLMNSSPKEPYPKSLPLLKESIKHFLDEPGLFKIAHPDRGISGKTVNKYFREFKKGMQLNDCFVTDKRDGENSEGSYYICEGMHRLNAYGVYKKMDIQDYEVKVYYQTDKDSLVL